MVAVVFSLCVNHRSSSHSWLIQVILRWTCLKRSRFISGTMRQAALARLINCPECTLSCWQQKKRLFYQSFCCVTERLLEKLFFNSPAPSWGGSLGILMKIVPMEEKVKTEPGKHRGSGTVCVREKHDHVMCVSGNLCSLTPSVHQLEMRLVNMTTVLLFSTCSQTPGEGTWQQRQLQMCSSQRRPN